MSAYHNYVEIERANAGCHSLTVWVGGCKVTATAEGYPGHPPDEPWAPGHRFTRAEYLRDNCLSRIGLRTRQRVEASRTLVVWRKGDKPSRLPQPSIKPQSIAA